MKIKQTVIDLFSEESMQTYSLNKAKECAVLWKWNEKMQLGYGNEKVTSHKRTKDLCENNVLLSFSSVE